MDERIVDFSDLLRRNGVRVSLAENIDTFRALRLVGVENPALFRSALRATLVKRAADIPTFEDLFDVFFFGLLKSVRDSDRSLMAKLGLTPREFQDLLEQMQRLLDQLGGDISDLARALLFGDMGQVERLLRTAAAQEGLALIEDRFQAGAYLRSLTARLGFARLPQEFERFLVMLEQLGVDAATRARTARYADERLAQLSAIIQDLIRQELKKNDIAALERESLEYLSRKSFSYYTEEDIRKMNEVVARLAQRFKSLLSLRRKKARRGRFDIKDTLRKNLQYGGVPFQIRLTLRKKEKPQVIVLCDISDSVLNASRFMLQFVYSVQELYSKVRSFVFVSDIGEVTRLFEENDIHQAIDMALRGEVIDVFCHSNFGHAFEVFFQEHLPAVTRKTTFLIIGDGRNNYNRANEWALREIQKKAKQLIWLNPESRLTWGFGDSEMPRYMRYCDLVEECRNISQLYKVIDRLVA